ncbi:hypothetical protein NXX20_06010 [Bacteroides stercoris]|nr:hypothetical protein [Bacteroides stercoris]
MGNMYVQIAIEINREQTAKRKFCNSQKKIISQLFIRKNTVHNPIINVQKQSETSRKTSFRNWGLPGFQLATAEPATGNRRARNWKTKLYM